MQVLISLVSANAAAQLGNLMAEALLVIATWYHCARTVKISKETGVNTRLTAVLLRDGEHGVLRPLLHAVAPEHYPPCRQALHISGELISNVSRRLLH